MPHQAVVSVMHADGCQTVTSQHHHHMPVRHFMHAFMLANSQPTGTCKSLLHSCLCDTRMVGSLFNLSSQLCPYCVGCCEPDMQRLGASRVSKAVQKCL
jgi:hypothetical protein